MMTPSASAILSMSPFMPSSAAPHFLSLFCLHFRHAMHPESFFVPILISSVCMPSFSSSSKTNFIACCVLPFALGLPLKATTFIKYLLDIICFVEPSTGDDKTLRYHV